MRILRIFLSALALVGPAGGLGASEAPTADSAVAHAPVGHELDVLTGIAPEDLPIRLTRDGEPAFFLRGLPVTVRELGALTDFELLTLLQSLAGRDLLLSEITAERALILQRLSQWLQDRRPKHLTHAAADFSTSRIRWNTDDVLKADPWDGYLIDLDRRSIAPKDIEDLSPLEIRQAVFLLTERLFDADQVLFNLEDFKRQLYGWKALVEREEFKRRWGVEPPLGFFMSTSSVNNMNNSPAADEP